jgi:type II secretory pathway predicted ATPase ExeA
LNLGGGNTSRVFTPRAVSPIAQTGGGNPASLNQICREAFLLGNNQLKKRIDPAKVRGALAISE